MQAAACKESSVGLGASPACEGTSVRIDAMAAGLRANGVEVEDGPDWWIVQGRGMGNVKGGAICASHLDHRIAMSFLVLGMSTQEPVRVDDAGPIATSFPIFEPLMAALGAKVSRVNA